MTVQELIDKLQKIHDKSIPIVILHEKMHVGSSQTGVWGEEECADINTIKFVGADELAALNAIDEVPHIELVSDDLIDQY